MLYPCNYIVPYNLLRSLVTLDSEDILALHSDATYNDIITCFRLVSGLNIFSKFCLSVHISNEVDEITANAIISFFFFPNYEKEHEAPMLIVHSDEEHIFKSATKTLIQCAALQGYTQLNILKIDTRKDSFANKFTSYDIDNVRIAYRKLLNDAPYCRVPFLIEIEKLTDINSLSNIFKEEESLFEKYNAIAFVLKLQNKQLLERISQLEQRNKAVEQEIKNHILHQDILRSSSHAAQLQNYYNNEYEILPLWYKRFGHIIKVVLGKRRFKSIFKENIKKY